MFKSVKIIHILSIICAFFQNAVKVTFLRIASHSGFWLDFPPRVSHVECVFQGEFVSCLLALLRHMKDRHYQQLLQSFTSKDDLRVRRSSTLSYWHQFIIHTEKHVKHPLFLSLSQDFLLHIFTVFRILIRPEMFPKDWTVMRLVTNKFETLFPCSCTWCGFQSINCDLKCLICSIIITTVLYLSDALRKNFLNDKFDYKVCSQSVCVMKHRSIIVFSGAASKLCFHVGVGFLLLPVCYIHQPALLSARDLLCLKEEENTGEVSPASPLNSNFHIYCVPKTVSNIVCLN